MTANFVFPPPPPPPPSLSTQNFASASYGNQHGNWNGSRGRGRGGGFRGQRGGNRGGYGNTWNALGHAHGASGGSGYSYQQRTGFSNNKTAPNYNTSNPQQHERTGESWQHNSTSYVPQDSYQQYRAPNFSSSPAYGQQPFTSQSLSLNNLPKSAVHNAATVAMGPPIRMGFNDVQDGAYAASPNHSYGATSTHYKIDNRPQNSSRGRGLKRQYGEAFVHRDVKPKPLTAPAVPSFGAPLVNPTPSVQKEAAQIKKKKKRQHNQLGLTPKPDEPEYSDDDVDEEAKLAASLTRTDGPQPLFSFSYQGRLTKLNSPEEIAAWIEERRKRFPTKLKVAEAKAQKALAQKRAREAKEKRAKEWQEQEEARHQADQNRKTEKNKNRRNKAENTRNRPELTEAEELRKTLEETQKRLAELEKKVERSQKDKSRKNTKSADSSSMATKPKTKRKRKPTSMIPEPLARSETLPLPSDAMLPLPNPSEEPSLPILTSHDSDDSISLPSTNPSDFDLEELTSSSDSSSSSSRSSSQDSLLSVSVSSDDLDSSDSDSASTTSSIASSAPSQHSASVTQHIPSSPSHDIPNPENSSNHRSNKLSNYETKPLCRSFLKHSRCGYRKCKFRHRFLNEEERVKHGGDRQRNGAERDRGRGKGSDRGRGRDRGKDRRKKGEEESWEDRPSLYQRLLRKQIEEEEAEEAERREKEREREEEQALNAGGEAEEGKGDAKEGMEIGGEGANVAS
ncbi:hypothetical protein MMC10_000703 [Thelotrema lepadinum]|nr:hypothetical protein [Thelotrema lepadinum]